MLRWAAVWSVVCVLVGVSHTQAGMITNGSLTVEIREDNGAINEVLFGGVDYFNPGTPVADYGFQRGSDTSTFVANRTHGTRQIPVAVSGTTVTGTFTGGGANVGFERVYELVGGLNVLRVTTTFVNNGSALDLAYFDAWDPDQGASLGTGGFQTFNDVFPLAGGVVGQARTDSAGNQHTVIAGSLDPRVVVSNGPNLTIGGGSVLNDVLDDPYDANDAYADLGLYVGLRTHLDAGESTTFTVDLAFGLTPDDAQDAFIAANTPSASPRSRTVVAGVDGAGHCRPGRAAAAAAQGRCGPGGVVHC